VKHALHREVLIPITRRIGSLIAGGLLALGATGDLASQVEVIVPALIALAVDLLLSHLERR